MCTIGYKKLRFSYTYYLMMNVNSNEKLMVDCLGLVNIVWLFFEFY